MNKQQALGRYTLIIKGSFFIYVNYIDVWQLTHYCYILHKTRGVRIMFIIMFIHTG